MTACTAAEKVPEGKCQYKKRGDSSSLILGLSKDQVPFLLENGRIRIYQGRMRYNALNRHLKAWFGEKVYKISLDTAGACPHIDESGHGCLFCNPNSNEPLRESLVGGIKGQLEMGANYIRGRHGAEKFISYFQRHTNTFGDFPTLKKAFEDAIDFPGIVGLDISTRPDSITNEMLELLAGLNKKTYLWVELGLQTADDDMLRFLRRGHTTDDFVKTSERLHEKGIRVCAHIIAGLPGEGEKEIGKTVALINDLNIEGIKIHNLHVLRGSLLEEIYNSGKIELVTLEEYAKLVTFAIEHLNPQILVHRFNAHSPRKFTVAPEWSVNKLATFNAVEDELKKQNTWQGKALGYGNSTF